MNTALLARLLTTLIVSLENTTAPSPAATAFSRANRRKGNELAQAVSAQALHQAVAFIRDQAPAKADHREAILTEAWTGLPGGGHDSSRKRRNDSSRFF
ncbi:hypothetical protein [Methylobacterium sp. E-045]|uniref:hypothetical protein n=1 Tax=Methylobacterium sp. E-045 TaxID=2836575 RepID=UPI001FB8DB3E|nr:hypothetical protein [Methylobacterium sp. E-045]MCJ2131723.1 hypothetical protein [Methylobacterium sp. E-045]